MPATDRTNLVPTAGSRFYLKLGLRVAPWLLAIFFACWSMRGVQSNNVADFDAPRHALNGAFILDMVRQGKLAHPVRYGYSYYAHLPALSLPYHPPIFPAFEAVFYAILGVNVFAARLAVAIATLAAFMLLYHLVLKSHRSRLLAAIVAGTFFALPEVQNLCSTVMLEIPALVFVLAALLFAIPDVDAFQSPRSIWFAVFAVTAIWTKQTVFLLPLPLIYVLISRKWRLLRTLYFWMTILLIATSVGALALSGLAIQWNSINQSWAKRGVLDHLMHNWQYYLRYSLPGIGLVLICLLTQRLAGEREQQGADRLYLAWLIAASLVLLIAPAYSERYLFFAIPPLLVLMYAALFRIGRRFLARRAAVLPPILVCSMFVLPSLRTEPKYLHGPFEAAHFVESQNYRRVLYCGEIGNGAFIFAIRQEDPSLSKIVIRGDKLPATTFEPKQLAVFLQRYGVQSVIFERTGRPEPWDSLHAESLTFLSQERNFAMSGTELPNDSALKVYRVANPSTVPENSLQLPISVLGRDVEVEF